MVHLTKKKKNGKKYLYLEERGWINGKSVRLWQIYLGPEQKFKERSQIIMIPEVETETIEFGLVAALLLTAERLGVVDIINEIMNKRNQGLSVGEHMLFAAINRCVQPTTKHLLKEWFNSTVLKRIYPKLGSKIDSRSYWTHFRYPSKEDIEIIGDEFAQAVVQKFNVNLNDLLFDPTNFFTYINPKKPNQTIPRHQHSKEGRSTLNLVNFSLFCTLDGGIPLLHLVFPGNINDTNHFKDALVRLKHRLNRIKIPSAEITLTFDKGNLSKEAFKYIDQEGFDYIASIRPSTQKDILSIPSEEFDMNVLPNGKEIGVKEFYHKVYGKKRRIIAMYNPNQAKWQIENFEVKVSDKINKIKDFFKDRLNNKLWCQEEKVKNKCEKVLGSKKFKKVIYIEITGEMGNLTLSVSKDQAVFNEQILTLGKSFLMTSREDLDALDVAWAYRQQYIIENAFKYLKNPNFLSIRQMYHRVDSSIKRHMFVCFLGLLLLALLVRDLIQQNIPLNIPKATKILKKIKITEITIPGRRKTIYKVNKMDEQAKVLYDALNLGQFV